MRYESEKIVFPDGTEINSGYQTDKAILSFPDLASATTAALSLPDGQTIDVVSEQKRYIVQGGILVFNENLEQLREDLHNPSGAELVKTQVRLNSKVTTLAERAKEVFYLQADGGIVADWDGVSGTDQTIKIQEVIDSFNGSRGVIDLGSGRIRCDSARIDFKRVVLRGSSTTDNGATGGIELYIGNSGGFYTSIQDNNGPRHENLRITSASTRALNGQTCLDLTGINYPSLQNVTIYGGENALKLSAGSVVESHYGSFLNVNTSRSYCGIFIGGGNRTQTHSFVGGRSWDCVVSCINAEGTSDINFFGTAFESDLSLKHINAGTNPSAAETKMFGCRDECDLSPDIPVGTLVQDGVYWSGYKKAREFSTVNGEIVWAGRGFTNAVRGSCEPIGRNLLRNAQLTPDLGGVVRGWTIPSGSVISELSGPRGRIWSWTRASSFQAWEQNGLNIKKGRYVAGFVVDKENTQNNGAILLQLTNSSGVLLQQGVDVDVDFSSANFTSIAGGHLGSAVVKEFEVLRDLTNIRYRAGINGMPIGQIGYFGSPFLYESRNADKYDSSLKEPEEVVYGTSIPSSGTWRAGALIMNPAITQSTPVERWTCISAGTPGTWRATSWIVGRGISSNRPTLTSSDIGVAYQDTSIAVAGKTIIWNGSSWVDYNGVVVV